MEDEDCYVMHSSHADTDKVQGMQSGAQGRGGVAKKVLKAEAMIQSMLVAAKENMMSIIPNWQQVKMSLSMTCMITFMIMIIMMNNLKWKPSPGSLSDRA
eukprot:3334959-Rhodomonas_salina.1